MRAAFKIDTFDRPTRMVWWLHCRFQGTDWTAHDRVGPVSRQNEINLEQAARDGWWIGELDDLCPSCVRERGGIEAIAEWPHERFAHPAMRGVLEAGHVSERYHPTNRTDSSTARWHHPQQHPPVVVRNPEASDLDDEASDLDDEARAAANMQKVGAAIGSAVTPPTRVVEPPASAPVVLRKAAEDEHAHVSPLEAAKLAKHWRSVMAGDDADTPVGVHEKAAAHLRGLADQAADPDARASYRRAAAEAERAGQPRGGLDIDADHVHVAVGEAGPRPDLTDNWAAGYLAEINRVMHSNLIDDVGVKSRPPLPRWCNEDARLLIRQQLRLPEEITTLQPGLPDHFALFGNPQAMVTGNPRVELHLVRFSPDATPVVHSYGRVGGWQRWRNRRRARMVEINDWWA